MQDCTGINQFKSINLKRVDKKEKYEHDLLQFTLTNPKIGNFSISWGK